MNLRIVALAFATLFTLVPHSSAAVCANINNCTFNLDTTSVGAFGPGPYGTVNLALSSSKITFTIDLATGFGLIDTGTHEAFTFNDTVGGTLVLDTFSDSRYSAGTSPLGGDNPPFSNFEHRIVYSGANNAGVNVLSFVVSRTGGFTDVNQLVELSTGGGTTAYFAADLYLNGVTGVAGVVGPPAVPEPAHIGILLSSGLGALIFLTHRRRKLSLS